MNPQLPGVYTQIGNAFERLFQWDNAQAAYEKAIAIDENDAFALEGLSSIYRRKKLNQETADMALRAVSLLHRFPWPILTSAWRWPDPGIQNEQCSRLK